MTMILSRNRLSYSGFTLVELAVVLLIVGFIIGAIWIAAGNVWSSYRIYRATQQITKSTQNIREYYMNAQQVPAGDITATLDGLNLFPVEMRRNSAAGAGNTPVDHPFNNNLVSGVAPANGSFHVQGRPVVSGVPISGFRIRMQGLTQPVCARLLTAVPVNDADLGIVQVGAQNLASGTTIITTPVALSTADLWCNQAGANNEADWDFKLRN